MISKYRNILAVLIGCHTTIIWVYVINYQSDISFDNLSLRTNKINNIRYNVSNAEQNQSKLTSRKQATVENLKISHVIKSECTNLVLPVNLLQVDSWSRIDLNKTVYVFAAYNVKQGGEIMALGASIKPPPDIYCQLWHVAEDNMTFTLSVRKANVRILPEDHGHKYSGAVFECQTSTSPTRFVSLVTSKCSRALNLLKVTNAITPDKYRRKFTVCLKPLHFEYSNLFELVEWIEFNRILGADRFVIYIYSIANSTSKVLDYYVKEGIVELVQWNLPMTSYTWPKTNAPIEMHSIGIVPSIQDCLLRNRAGSEFIVNIDVDEFITPRANNVITWHEMMKHVSANYDTYVFRNVFFRKDWNNDLNNDWNKTYFGFHGNELVKKYNLITLQTVLRENRISESMSRSKYFTKTTKLDKLLMIHIVKGGRTQTVPVTMAMLHHYRNWEKPNKPSTRIRDDLVLTKYGETLIQNIDKTWKNLEKKLKLAHK